MECKMDSGLLQEYVDGTLGHIECGIVEEHLKSCRMCRKEVNDIKLLNWELDSLFKEDIEIPQEAASIRDKTIEKICSIEKGYSFKEFLSTQKKVLRGSLSYTKFIPGAKAGTNAVRKAAKKAPVFLMKAAGNLLIGGTRFVAARGRA